MAKKAKNKKSAKPAKKKVVKKVTKSKPVAKKANAKKVVKPVKKAKAKKSVKPAKKASVKKPLKKKAATPAKKKLVKKIAKSKPVKKVVAKKPLAKKAVVKKPLVKKVVAKPTKVKKEDKQILKKAAPVVVKPVERKPMLKRVAPVSKKRGEEQFTSIPGIFKKDEFVIDKRPLSELNINQGKPLIKKMFGTKPTPHVSTDKRTRYTDKELQEFKQIIIRKLDEARKDYELLKSTLSHKDDHGTDDTSPTFKLLEDGSDVLSKEETAQLAGRQEKFIQSLQNALVRIENKTYGICRVTGKLISKERLRSVPHATLAIEAKLEQTS